jgi:hypothetical protein
MTNSSKPVELISAETLALGERMRRLKPSSAST